MITMNDLFDYPSTTGADGRTVTEFDIIVFKNHKPIFHIESAPYDLAYDIARYGYGYASTCALLGYDREGRPCDSRGLLLDGSEG